MLRPKLQTLSNFYWPEMVNHNHSDQSEVSGNGPKWFAIPNNLVLENKIKWRYNTRSLSCFMALLLGPAHPDKCHLAFGPLRLKIAWPCLLHYGPNEFLIPKNLGIDTKNKFLACSERKLQIWACLSHYNWSNWPKRAILATQVNLRCLEMVPMNFSYPKTWG